MMAIMEHDQQLWMMRDEYLFVYMYLLSICLYSKAGW